MKLRTLIIDDEKFALEKLKNYVKQIPFLELVAACSGTTEALSYLGDNDIDVIFTDIDMPDVNGIRFVESLSNGPYIVFITAYRDFAVDGFRLSAIDYLVKPYDLADFQRAANKVMTAYKKDHILAEPENSNENSIFIKVGTKFLRLDLSDIRYIKAYGEYLQVYVEGLKNPYLTLGSFGDMMKRLSRSFIQVHRSYAVNMDKIQRIENNRIIMDEDTYISVSATHHQAFLDYLQSRSVGKLPKH